MSKTLLGELTERDTAWWRREIPARDQCWMILREIYDTLRAAEMFGQELEQWDEIAACCIRAGVSEIEWREKEVLDVGQAEHEGSL